ncbi:MAG: hypothetical protein ACUVT7_00275, partial [Thermoplasmata archaeon]
LRHVVLNALTLVAGITAIYLGFKYLAKREGKMFTPPARRRARQLVGSSFIVLWLVTLAVGINIFVKSYFP